MADTEESLREARHGWQEAEARLAEANDMLRAIRNGEVDALVIGDGEPGRQVFTLSSADRPYRMFVESMSDGAATVSDTGVVLYANSRLAEMLLRPVQQIVGSQITALIPEDAYAQLVDPPALTGTVEAALVDADGHRISVLIGVSKLNVEGYHLTCLTFTDLTARRAQDEVIGRLNQAQIDQLRALQEAQAALTLKATHDSLTGLPNRMLLVDRIEQALERAKRTGCWTAVLFVDLDRFKHINDSRGHAAGDDVLRHVAERLKVATRSSDTVARLGGDEFVVLASDLVGHIESVHIAARLAGSLRSSITGAPADEVTASIGVSVSASGEGSAELLLHQADTAMYHAKSLGRNRTEVFDVALSLRVADRSAAEQLLRLALDEHRVIPYYQPIVDLSTGEVAGFEALARIAAADQKVLTPDAFIDVAEECGLIVPLGAQMLRIACRDARRWGPGRSASPSPTVAVNLSPRQLERGDLAAQIRRILGEVALEPSRLHLEITETALMELDSDVVRQLVRVRDLGVEIGLDDFGTGYASLTHLRRLPVSFVKVDQSFISRLGADVQDERIVAAVIDLAANLGLRSIAEGIETPQQLDRLRALGCEHAQGYLFARPGPTAEPHIRYPVQGAHYPPIP